MTLSDYIAQHGDAVCAALWLVKERTVASWRRRENYPRPHHARRIVETTHGEVSHEGIYGVPRKAA